ncbi:MULTISPECIES: 16S rRNA (uracil(1498)-N(3))-methyltransferase [Nocardiopsis]|uniref:Ribosomal RNA small subunit methyltransferase E n=1 Tax=Nocardiopsis sinuspersici TaxID=501010 RepID=A0A1V3BWN2_9ACTN|nr:MULTISPECIES: 16S rRNA (uracil(1498)-N(3))-methyltransferase [Nocardiopsis]OOC52997.1 16S rRNA (uracil(1498)-N(3))-methyltransferase [Nocardiopsis sinuspersici]
MTPPVFLVGTADLAADRVTVGGAEGRHAAVVRRVREGETVDLSDGRGLVARCTVAAVAKDHIVCAVVERREDPAPRPRLTVVQALPKGDRGELAVEMMTEAGADAIVPWSAERCVTRWKGERAAKSLAKWRATAREAAKQARRGRLPEVADLADRSAVADLLAAADLGIVLHEDGDDRLSELEPPTGDGPGIVLVVGPEGGFSDTELDAFTGAGAVRALLGPSVLRTSTAGVAALSVLQARTGRW